MKAQRAYCNSKLEVILWKRSRFGNINMNTSSVMLNFKIRRVNVV